MKIAANIPGKEFWHKKNKDNVCFSKLFIVLGKWNVYAIWTNDYYN